MGMYHLKALGVISATIFRALLAEMTSVLLSIYLSIYLWPYSPLLDLGRFFSFLILYTVCMTPWTGDQPVARPLPTHRTTQTQNKYTDIHVLSGIRTRDPSVRASEDSSCL
jgi:hypothetical protein